MSADDLLATRFEADRPHLRAVAYRLLGSSDDADDAVQAAWLKVSQADLQDVRNLTGWLTTVTARECLDQLRVRKRRGEVFLPDDEVVAAFAADAASVDEKVQRADSVGRALMVVLDRLSPAQRVAFVLHDLFAVPFEEIGRLLDRSPLAAKKLASRARQRVHGEEPADQRPTADQLRIVEAFLSASQGGDIPVLLELLAPDVVRRVDPTFVPAHVAAETRGASAVAEESRLFAARARLGAVVLLDGEPGIVLAPAGRLRAVLRLGIAEGRIRTIDIIATAARIAPLTVTLPR